MTGEVLQKICIRSDPAQLRPVRDAIRQLAQQLQLHITEAEEIVLATNEACMNIMQHGYKDDQNGKIVIELIQGNAEIIVRVTDHAPAIDTSTLISRPMNELRPGGLGLHFIRSVMDNTEYKTGDNNIGNTLEMRKKINL